MLTVESALELVLAEARPGSGERVGLRDALHRTLAEDIQSDVDSPPHDKSLVDGYAVMAADFAGRVAAEPGHDIEMLVIEEVTAGGCPTSRLTSGHATRIMTGAPIPEGADAVVMFEQTETRDEPGTPLGVVRFLTKDVVVGKNIMTRGASLRRGQVVLHAGTALGPAQIGLMAEVGRSDLQVYGKPRVAVLPTGNELVEPEIAPAAGKIRNSNGPMLAACGERSGAEVKRLDIGRDDPQQLEELIRIGLECDVLVISGGVSAGVLDLVPSVLARLGVREIFHKVQLKPGKPLWFGVTENRADGDGSPTLVFGLPGNPLSSFVCFELFVAPVLARMAGRLEVEPPRRLAALEQPHEHSSNRPTFQPAQVSWPDGDAVVTPIAWKGSSDLASLAACNALAVFPSGRVQYQSGDRIECRLLQ